MQYLPVDGVYVYFRYDEKQTVMCVMNTNANASSVNPARFDERINRHKTAKNVANGEVLSLKESFSVPAYTTFVFELK
jgi:hypothetical protein